MRSCQSMKLFLDLNSSTVSHPDWIPMPPPDFRLGSNVCFAVSLKDCEISRGCKSWICRNVNQLAVFIYKRRHRTNFHHNDEFEYQYAIFAKHPWKTAYKRSPISQQNPLFCPLRLRFFTNIICSLTHKLSTRILWLTIQHCQRPSMGPVGLLLFSPERRCPESLHIVLDRHDLSIPPWVVQRQLQTPTHSSSHPQRRSHSRQRQQRKIRRAAPPTG